MPEGVTWTTPAGGFSLVVRLPEPLDSAALLPVAAQKGVLFTAGRVFSLSGDARILRLSFGNLPLKTVSEGIRRLAAVVKEELARSGQTAGRQGVGALVPPV